MKGLLLLLSPLTCCTLNMRVFSPVTSSSLALLDKAAHVQLFQNRTTKLLSEGLNCWAFLYVVMFHDSIRSQTGKDTRACSADGCTSIHPPPSKNKCWEGNVTPGSPDLSWTLFMQLPKTYVHTLAEFFWVKGLYFSQWGYSLQAISWQD